MCSSNPLFPSYCCGRNSQQKQDKTRSYHLNLNYEQNSTGFRAKR
jgi:hypothetical protein